MTQGLKKMGKFSFCPMIIFKSRECGIEYWSVEEKKILEFGAEK
jgi:hypothetical protein